MISDSKVNELVSMLDIGKETDISSNDYIKDDILEKVYQYALDQTISETDQAAEGLFHNLNSLQSRSGNQLPFSSINFGTSTSKEGRAVIEALLKACIDGTGKYHRTSIFPCGIFQYQKGINDKPGTPNYDLKRLALHSTSKRLYPNYANQNWSSQKAWVASDRSIKNEVIKSLSEEKKNAIIKLIQDDPSVGSDLYLHIENGELVVDPNEHPEEIFSTMGALAGHEHLYVKINGGEPRDISIKDLYYLCKGDDSIKGRPAQIHFNKDLLDNPSTDPNWRQHQTGYRYGFRALPGTYKITYLPEDVTYIGSARNISRRFAEHRNSIKRRGGLDVGLYFADSQLDNYLFEVISYTDDMQSAEELEKKFISEVPNANFRGTSNNYYKNVGLSKRKGLYHRPSIGMDPSVPQDLIDLSDADIKVYDRDNKWVKVKHIFRNDEMNTPYMMHITYSEGQGKNYTLCCTEDHPLWTGSKFTKAAELTLNDHIYRADGKQLDIVDIRWYTERRESYDIGTETGTFIGSDIIMHNCRTANGFDVNYDKDYYLDVIHRALNHEKINHLILSGAQKDGRGNICPITVIMPTLAMEASGEVGSKNVEEFLNILDTKIHEAKDMLIERFEWICSQDPSSASFMYNNKTMAGYIPEEGIRSALEHGTLALGQLGLAETLQILIGCDHTEKRGMDLAKRIEQLFSVRCTEFKKKYKLNFGVYYTPAESLCYTAMKKFQSKYGNIPNISDREYFTNSIHVPVWKKMSPFDKIDIESQLTGYSNAGCITYVEVDGSTINNIDALEEIVDYAMDHDIPYFAINVPSDSCLDCGHQGEFNRCCPECGSTNIQQLRRVTGYLSTDYHHFNIGKQQEVEHRVDHVNRMTTLEGDDING